MGFCYRLKMRIPFPHKAGSKLIQFRVPVPFKSRRASGGRFGYSDMDGGEKNRVLERTLKFFKNREYRAF